MTEALPSITIEFDPPIEWNSRSVSAIELREPRAGEVVKAQAEMNGSSQAQWKFGMSLIGLVSGEPRQIIEQMPVSKLIQGITYLTSFLSDDGPPIGENSSSI